MIEILARRFDVPAAQALRPLEAFVNQGHPARERVERIVRTFLESHHTALRKRRPDELAAALDAVEVEWRGFAYEGAGMGLALVDALAPARWQRLAGFVSGAGAPHAYMLIVGAGWASARLPRLLAQRVMRSLEADPLLAWLAWDGRGFHDGFFFAPRAHRRKEVPRELMGYARRAYDQGLGRSLWFVEASDRLRIPAAIECFAPERRADLWSGVGLACAYAGGESDATISALFESSGCHRAHYAQGVAFAAGARQRAGNPAPHTERACDIAWSESQAAVAELVTAALAEAREGAAPESTAPRYELWRAQLRERYARHPSRSSLEREELAHAARP